MKKIVSYLRIEEWLSSKVTFMVGILLYFAYFNHSKTEDTIRNFIAFFLYVSMFLAISYVANDFSDLEIDKKVGKKKVIASMPKWKIWTSFVIMTVVGNCYILICAKNKWTCLIIMMVTYFLGLAYSTLGIRFKERGLLGLIECSFAQKCMPLVMIVCLENISGVSVGMLIAWMIFSFVDGLRYIVIHQVIDLKNDIISGVNTYVAEKKGNYKKILVLFYIAEWLAVIALILPLWIRQPIATGGFVVVNIILEYCIYVVIQKYAGKDIFLTYDSVPLEAFLNILFPILTAVCLALINPVLSIFVLLLIAICVKPFMIKLEIVAVYIKSKI